MLETERLILRNGKQEDIHDFLGIRNSAFVLKYNAMEICDEEQLFKEISDNFVLERKKDHKIIGFIGIEKDMLRYGVTSACISYYLDEKEAKHGYMSEALKSMLSYLFEQGIEIVGARVFVGNDASVSLLKKLGFTHEGTLRHAVQGYGGIIYDDQLFSLLKEEWIK
ncbi:GNAT family protein [uncultured Traorella sp.]|uniref:GNAT family N-acetyltransferase n=1 Tax=uncultured Traorella sp. TaxID=1929048 RepID=UPI0025D517DC|nr:GNAT family protein [uncultured Traorella sp.]